MATIPIEVIVQDAPAPVVPGEDGTNNTETNITVPDTGTISSSGDTSSSASSIILPAILLVLAIGSIVAILIHKHHKQKNNKTTRKEKLAVATSSTIAVLAVTVLIGNLVIPATKAATSDVADTITPTEDKVSIIVTRDGGVAEESIESTATITSTSDFGYKVLLSMVEGAETNNLYLDGNVDSDYYISATESTELSDNTWGYTLTEDDEYSAVPLLDNAVVVAQGDEPVEDEDLSIYYGVKVSSDLPTGTYSGGEIEYSLVALEPTIATLTYMQDFASLSESGKASVFSSMTEDEQYYLKDIRDDKTYRIAKLKDGNVWMTQNLDLQKEDLLMDVTLDSNNTDNPVLGFTLPNSQIDGDGGWGSFDDTAAVNTSRVYDIAGNGQTYYYCIENYWMGCRVYDTTPIPSSDFGNYYNWYTATAGTGNSDSAYGAIAGGSICPAGWRLFNSTTDYDSPTEYGTLLYLYGTITSPTSGSKGEKFDEMFGPPLYLARVGEYGGGVQKMGDYGYIWSSMSPRYMTFDTSSVNVNDYFYKTAGFSVRCLVR